MIHTLKRFWNDESGPELVEWAVVTIILLVAAIVLYVAVGNLLGNVLCAVQCWLEKASKGSKQNQINDKNSCDTVTQDTSTGKCSGF